MRFLSLFSGVGGLDLGLEQAGMTCATQVEKDKFCLEVLKKHWPDVPKIEDVKNVTRENTPTVGLICGGFPCQDVSVSGRRAGLAGEQSGLWFEFARIIKEIKPKWVVIENVPGLLSSNGGRDMGTVVGALAKLGYWWAYRVLDLQYFGIPQRRRRVFIVGCLRKGCPQEVLFERESVPWGITSGKKERAQATGTIGKHFAKGGFSDGCGALVFTPQAGGRTGFNINKNLSGTLQANQQMAVAYGGNNQNQIDVATTLNHHSGRYDFESETLICNTFNGYTGGADDNDAQGWHIVPSRFGVRRLMPIECERLQGFPDNWTGRQSDTQRYRQLGNAVGVPKAKWIGERIMMVERGEL